MQQRYFAIIILSILIGISSNSSALSIQEALTIAESHPLLKIYDSVIQKAKTEQKIINKRGPSELSLVTEKLGGKSGFNVSEIKLEYAIPLKNHRLARAVENLVNITKNSENLKKNSLKRLILNETVKSFSMALAMCELVEKAQQNIENSKKLLEVSKIMAETGSISESEVYKAELALKQAELELSVAEGEYQTSLFDLSSAMGLKESINSKLEGDSEMQIVLPNSAELQELLLRQNPEIINANTQLAYLSGEQSLLRMKSKPEWKLITGATNDQESRDTSLTFGFNTEFSNKRDSLGEIKLLEEEKKHLLQVLENITRESLLSLNNLLLRFKRIKHQLTTLKSEIIPSIERLYQLSIEGFSLGKTGQTDVLLVQQELLAMRKTYWFKVIELIDAATSIENLTGFGFSYMPLTASE